MAYNTHSHLEFRKRVKRVDAGFSRWGYSRRSGDTTARRPFPMALAGFGWAYLVISVASNRAHLESSLNKGSLPAQFHDYIMIALTVLLAVSLVALAVHVMRLMGRRGGKRTNSGAMLTGVLGALMLVYTPASVWQTGFDMLDGNSRNFVMAASATVSDALPGIDLSKAVFVSSLGQ